MKQVGLIVIIISLLLACKEDSEPRLGSISGHVHSSDSTIDLSTGAILLLTADSTRTIIFGADGGYQFDNLPFGSYSLVTKAEDFVNDTTSFLLEIEHLDLDIHLEPQQQQWSPVILSREVNYFGSAWPGDFTTNSNGSGYALLTWGGPGSSGALFATSNFGQNWHKMLSGDGYWGSLPQMLLYANVDTILVLSNGTIPGVTLTKSFDGGKSWTTVPLEGVPNLYDKIYPFIFSSKTRGLAFAYSYSVNKPLVIQTTDGGITWSNWSAQPLNEWPSFIAKKSRSQVVFVNKLIGFYLANTKCYKTLDGGITWELSFQSNASINFIKFMDDHTGFLGSSELFKTTDSGLTWSSYYGKKVIDVAVPSPTATYIVDDNGDILKSTEGQKWRVITKAKPGIKFGRVSFFNERVGLVGSDQSGRELVIWRAIFD